MSRASYERIKGARTLDERRTVGRALQLDILAGIQERSGLKDRWTVNEAYHRNQPPRWSNPLLPDCEMMHFPLTQPKIDRMAGATVRTICNPDPMLMANIRGPNERERRLERTIQYFHEVGGLERRLRMLGTIAAITDVGILKCSFDLVTEDELDSHPDMVTMQPGFAVYAGFRYEVRHPNDFVMFPATPFGMVSAKLVGDRFWQRRSTILAKQRDGRYFDDVTVTSGHGPGAYESGRDFSFSYLAANMSGSDSDDQLVECWEVIFKAALEPDRRVRRYLATVAMDTGDLLCIRRYRLTKPWYSVFAFKDIEYGSFWPSRSVAQDLQGLQRANNHLNNLLIYGSYVAAIPALIGEGLPSKAIRYMAGDLIEAEGQITPIVTRFDPAAIPLMIERIERLADAVVRVSTLAVGQQTKPGTTATEVAELIRSQGTNDNDYLVNFGSGLLELADIEREQLYYNYAYWKPIYGEQVPLDDPSVLALPTRWQLQGKNPNSTPEALLMKFEALLEKAIQFPDLIDVVAVLRCYVNAMETGNEDQIMPEQPAVSSGPAAGVPQGELEALVPQLKSIASAAGYSLAA